MLSNIIYMENNNNLEKEKSCDQEEKKKVEGEPLKINFWRWYFPRRPIILIRFLLFSYFIQWFVWNFVTLLKKDNFQTVFLLQKTWNNLGGITLVFGPILGTIFILVTFLPLIMMWVFYALSVSKWEIKDPALRIWAGVGIVLVPFLSTLFFKLLALILVGVGY